MSEGEKVEDEDMAVMGRISLGFIGLCKYFDLYLEINEKLLEIFMYLSINLTIICSGYKPVSQSWACNNA